MFALSAAHALTFVRQRLSAFPKENTLNNVVKNEEDALRCILFLIVYVLDISVELVGLVFYEPYILKFQLSSCFVNLLPHLIINECRVFDLNVMNTV